MIKKGYDSIHTSFIKLLSDTDTYYIGSAQVESADGYWQYRRIYDDAGQIVELQYLDKEGNLTLHKNGYAVIKRSYNDAGLVKQDLYYGIDWKPAESLLGQYGYSREYDEKSRTTLTTYLGADEKPANTSKGYAIETRTYGNSGMKLQYYDVNNKPVTIERSQFGIMKVNGQSIYLDEDGEVMFQLDNILHTHPWIVMASGVALALLAVRLRGKWKVVYLLLYILFILYMTTVYRETRESKGAFELFYSYRKFFSSSIIRQNILNNIWLFVPLGVALYNTDHQFCWFWAIGLSIVIEAVQWYTGIGLAEVYDVISNGLGAMIGFLFVSGITGMRYSDCVVKNT